MPTFGKPVDAPRDARFERLDNSDGTQYAVYAVQPGTYQFNGEG